MSEVIKLINATGDISLSGVTIQLQKVDGNLEAITIIDSEGKSIRIVQASAYSSFLKVLIPEPKKYKDVYCLRAKHHDGTVITWETTSKEAADRKQLYFEESGGYSVSVEINQIEINDDSYSLNENTYLEAIPF